MRSKFGSRKEPLQLGLREADEPRQAMGFAPADQQQSRLLMSRMTLLLWVQLLYLVPCCLGGVALIAAARGDLQRAINFTDATPTTLLQDIGKEKSE